MQLNKIQSSFKNLMLDHPDAIENLPDHFGQVFDPGKVAISKRLKIYRNNIIGSLTDVMIATFPIIEALVGKEFLEQMARSFILQNPPSKACLSFYGIGFDTFIKGFEPAKTLPYLPDIARLEIAMNDAYYAKDDLPLNALELSEIAQEALEKVILRFRTSVNFVSSEYPLSAIKQFCENVSDETQSLDINQGGEALLIYRPDLDVRLISLSNEELAFLSFIHNGDSLGYSTSKTLEQFENFDVGHYLSKHIELETFSSLRSNI